MHRISNSEPPMPAALTFQLTHEGSTLHLRNIFIRDCFRSIYIAKLHLLTLELQYNIQHMLRLRHT